MKTAVYELGKAESFMYALSYFFPIDEDETLTQYRAYSKELEKEVQKYRKKIKELEKTVKEIQNQNSFDKSKSAIE